MYADAAESEKTGKIPADGSREDPAQGFLIFSEFADAGDLYFGAPARKSLKTLDFSRVLFFFRCLSIYCFQYVVKLLYNLDTMNGELFEVVNFVATTHPMD